MLFGLVCIGAGVEDFTVTLETQEVVVRGSIPFDDLTARIAKTGKAVRPVPIADNF